MTVNGESNATDHTLTGTSSLTEEVRHIGCDAINTRHDVSRGSQRSCERTTTRDGQHSGPPSSPSKECRALKSRGRIPGSCRSEALDKLHCLRTPTSARLEGNHNQTAPASLDQLSVFRLFVSARFGQHCTVHSCGVGASGPARGQSAAHVHRELSSVVEGQTRSKDFY